MRRILYLLSALSAIALAQSPPMGCHGTLNKSPVLDLPPQILKTVANGQKWIMNDNNSTFVYIAKVRGSAYEMGKAMGQLFADEFKKQFASVETMYPEIIGELLEDFGIL